jgi:hypothetical protein
MQTAAYRWHVALTSAGGLYATVGALVAAVGLVIWLFSDLALPLVDSLVAIVGVIILGLGATEVTAGWVVEQALPPDAPRRRPYVRATGQALRGLLMGIVLPPVVGTLVLPTLFAYNMVKEQSEREA